MTEPRSILLVTSNGFGMGHLVRQLAIAAAMPEGVRCTVLTLSQAAPVAVRAGAVLEYCPSYTSRWISKRRWHRGYLRDRIVALATAVDADVVAFDGVVPYIGLINALERLPVARVWFRRGVWRDVADPAPLGFSTLFDCIIEPGDLGAPRDEGPTARRSDAIRIGVVTQAGERALLPRETAAARLGVDAQRRTVLFNVGSNAIPGLADIIEQVAAEPGWNVLTTKDALGRNRSAAAANVQQVSGVFPLHPYLAAVDLAVTSVGYNAAHEFVAAHVPTVLVPADNATDDQRARALAIADADAGVVVDADDPEALLRNVLWLMRSDEDRLALRDGTFECTAEWQDGAAQAAELLMHVQAGAGSPTALARLRRSVRTLAERLLALREPRVRREFRLTDDLLTADLNGEVAIEHLHPGLGADYLRERERIARRWFG